MKNNMWKVNLNKQLNTGDSSFELSVNFDIQKGDFVAIYGKSGAGKTSLLRMIAGLTTPDSGSISSGEEIWFDAQQKINFPVQRRKIGYVFQDYALFPNMTVRGNVEYARGKQTLVSEVDELLALLELSDLATRKPETLSGGQKQRVALARTLIQQPDLLLLDEPLSALDQEMRFKLQELILKLHQKFELTTVLVSHDLSEIVKMANQVVKLDNGKIRAIGSPEEVLLSKQISAKFNIPGTVVSIQKADAVHLVNVLTGTHMIQVVVTHQEAKEFKPGDTVLVFSKAFNPIIVKSNDSH